MKNITVEPEQLISCAVQILVEWCRGSDKSGAEVLE